MLEWFRKRLNDEHEREVAYQQRVEHLQTIGQRYRIPEVLEHIKSDILRLKDGEGVPGGYGSIWTRIDKMEYRVGGVNLKDPKNKKQRKNPAVKASIIQSVEGKILRRHDDRSQYWFTDYSEYTITIDDDGVIHGFPKDGTPVIFGTTASIRNHDQLQSAVDRTLGFKRSGRPQRKQP